MIGFDVELEGELTVDGLDELAQMRVQVTERPRGLTPLVTARRRDERDVALGAQVDGDRATD